MNKTRIAYTVAMSGYFGLLLLLGLWITLLSPPKEMPISLALIVFVGPLLLFLRGLLHGRPKQFVIAPLLSLLYMLHGIVDAYGKAEQQWLPVLEVLFCVMFYFGGLFFARWRSKELKLAQQERSS